MGLRQQLGLSTNAPCTTDSEAHEVSLPTRYFDRSALAFCSILAFTYNGRFSSGSFCSRLGGPAPLEDDFLHGSPQLWCFWQRESLILGFWLFVLISDLCDFLLLVFALAIKVGTLGVHMLSLISVLFFGTFITF